MTTTPPLVISTSSLAGDDAYAVVYSNLSYVNVVLEEGGAEEDLHPDSLLSYAVDFLHGQVRNGGFSQFLYNTRWNEGINARITQGLASMGATEHLAWFERRSAQVAEVLGTPELAAFLDGDYFGDDPFRDALDVDSALALDADLVALHSAWLREHPDLQPHTIPEMFARAEDIVGHEIHQEH